jgi:hypothetical protein
VRAREENAGPAGVRSQKDGAGKDARSGK